MTPNVSVIMPVYNAAGTVRAAVESVVRQNLADLELILIDDGSTDSTLAVLDSLCVPGMQVIRQGNAGASAARNRGIASARGQLIAFLDADDQWLPGKLQAQCQALMHAPRAHVAYGWVDFVDEEGRFVHRDRRANFDGRVYTQLLVHNFIASGSNILVKREALEHVGGYDESLRAVEDWELNTRLAAAFEFVHVPQVVTRYRKTDDSLSSNIGLMEKSFLAAQSKVFAAAPPEQRHKKAQCTASFYHYLVLRSLQTGDWRRNPSRTLRLLGVSWRAAPGGSLRVLKVLNPWGPMRYTWRRLVRRYRSQSRT